MRSAIVVALAGLVSFAVPLARATDEPDEAMPGRVVIVKGATAFRFVSRPDTTFDLPDPTNDPAVEGALLEVFDTVGGTSMSVTLPAGGWKGLGNPAGATGYKYTSAGTPSDPCRVLVKSTLVKAVCRGSGVTLTTPFFGNVGILLTVGTDTKRYCAQFGGTIVRNDATVTKRKDAPAPSVCPAPLTPPYCYQSAPACGGSCEVGFTCFAHPTFGCVCMNN